MAENQENSNSSTTNKASTTEQRQNKKEISTTGIELVKQIVNILKPYELSPSQRLKTFRLMMLDDAVYNAFDTNAVFVEGSFAKYTVEHNLNSEKSKEAAEFLQWNLNNLDKQTVRSIARSAIEFKRDGLSPFEKIFERGFAPWATTPAGLPTWKIKKLNYVSPLTLWPSEPFVIDEGGSNIKEMRQSNTAFKNSQSSNQTRTKSTTGYTSIPAKKLMLMTYSATDAQPFGTSPFEACYTAWREKVLLQDLTSVGVSKDLAGTPILMLPSNILNDAAADPTSSAGLMVAQLKESMANLHAGDQASMIMPSDTFSETGNGAKEFEIKFLGVDGGGKSFDLEALVEQRRKFIYSVFGAANLISNDSSGGYNQLEGQTNLHSHFIERDIAVIEEAWNNNLIPQLFRLNEWELDQEDIPKIKAGDLAPPSLDEVGKMVQRLASTGFLPKTKEVVNELLAKVGLSYRVDSDMTEEEFDKIMGSMESSASKGMTTPFEGTSKGGGSNGNSSDVNSDNAS